MDRPEELARLRSELSLRRAAYERYAARVARDGLTPSEREMYRADHGDPGRWRLGFEEGIRRTEREIQALEAQLGVPPAVRPARPERSPARWRETIERLARAAPGGRGAARAAAERVEPRSPLEVQVAVERSAGRVPAAAIHEAGHAVAAVLLGRRLASVALHWRRTSDGRLEFAGGSCSFCDSDSIPAAVYFAGAEAVELAGLGAVAPTWWNRPDLRSAARRIEAMGDDPVTRAAEERRRARAILRGQWPAVRAVSGALLARGELDGPEAEALVLATLDAVTRDRIRAGWR